MYLFDRRIDVVHQRSFRDFHLQLRRVQLVKLDHPLQLLDQAGHDKLRAAQADAKHKVGGKPVVPSLALGGPWR